MLFNIRRTSKEEPPVIRGVNSAGLRSRHDDRGRQTQRFSGRRAEEVRRPIRDSLPASKPDMKPEPHQRPARD